MKINVEDFFKVDIRKGKVVESHLFKEARKPAYKLWIDFGDEIGIKKSSAQITDLYKPEDLIGKSVLAVVNLQPRQIGPFMSEVLTLGVTDNKGAVTLLGPDKKIPNGGRMH